jgi:hypothetical protein
MKRFKFQPPLKVGLGLSPDDAYCHFQLGIFFHISPAYTRATIQRLPEPCAARVMQCAACTRSRLEICTTHPMAGLEHMAVTMDMALATRQERCAGHQLSASLQRFLPAVAATMLVC